MIPFLTFAAVAVVALAPVPFQNAPKAQDSKPATAPAGEPLRIRIYKTGDEKSPVWNLAVENQLYGTKQFDTWIVAKGVEYKKTAQGLSEKDPKFAITSVDQTVVIDAEPGAPFGYVQTALEGLAKAMFYKIEFAHPAGRFVQWLMRDEDAVKNSRRIAVSVFVRHDPAKGLTRSIGSILCRDDEELGKVVSLVWGQAPKEPNITNIGTVIVGGSNVPWSAVFNVLRKMREKGVQEIVFTTKPNELVIPDQPRK